MRVLKKELWPYQVALDLKEYGPDYDPEEWCRRIIGIRFKDWYSYKQGTTWVFAFKDEATLLVFKLAWRW